MTYRFPNLDKISWKAMLQFAKEQGWKYPHDAGMLNDKGDYYCVVCASQNPFDHIEEAHREIENFKLFVRNKVKQEKKRILAEHSSVNRS